MWKESSVVIWKINTKTATFNFLVPPYNYFLVKQHKTENLEDNFEDKKKFFPRKKKKIFCNKN